MNLKNKKDIASKTLGVGKGRIVFVEERLSEIKEALTKEDIRGLHAEGAILLKDIKGRKKNVKRKNKKGTGNVRKKVNTRKQDYVKITRKLRNYISELEKQGKLTRLEVKEIRKKIRNRTFKSKANLKLYLEEIKK
jgi:large subunit ribosomal protein L19e